MISEAQIFDTERFTIIVVPKLPPAFLIENGEVVADLPERVLKASTMWKNGVPAKEICKALHVKATGPNHATYYISTLRSRYSTRLFPYRTDQLKKS